MIRRTCLAQAAVLFTLTLVFSGCGSGSPTSPNGGSTVSSVSLTPATDTVVPGQTAQLIATPRDGSGAALAGQQVIWSTSPTTVATVNDVGVVTGVTTGTATVTATSGGKSATATLTVLAGGMITASGGTVSTSDGSVRFTFPAGAVAVAMPVSIRPAVGTPGSNSLIGTAYEFGPTGTQFAQSVTVTLKYDPATLPSNVVPSLIQVYTASTGAWTAVPGSTVDTAAHTVTASLSHFSPYSLCAYSCIPTGAPHLKITLHGCDGPCPFGVTAPIGAVTTENGGIVSTDVGLADTYTTTFTGLPAGVTAQFLPAGASSFSVQFTVAASAIPGGYHIVLIATAPGEGSDAIAFPLGLASPSYTIDAVSGGFSIAQGGTLVTPLTLTRTFWTSPVDLSAQNLPAGTTASFSPASTPGNASNLTLNVGAGTAPGNYTITLRGVSPGHADITTSVGLTVTPGTGFTLTGTPAFATVAQGSSGSTGLQVTRTNFSNSIAYTFAGLPAGVTAAVAATSVADSNKLTFTATAGATPGTYPITVAGTSGSTVRNTMISLVVSLPGSTIVQADFSGCNASQRPVWVVYQDGSGSFTQATGNGSIYPITFNSARGVIAAVIPTLTGGSFTTVVNYGTPAELLTLPWNCNDVAFGAGKTIGVSATGMLANDFGDIGMGGAYDGSLTFGGPTVPIDSATLGGVASGLQDLIAYRFHSSTPGADVRWAIRRDQNIPNGGSAATIDFNGPESFAPVTGNYSVAAGAEQATMKFGYITAPGCAAVRYGVNLNGVTQPLGGNTFYGVPAAQQRAADLHVISASTPTRFAASFVHTVTQSTVAVNLGAGMPTPTITAPSGPYKRIQAVFNLPSDYVFTQLWYGAGVIQAATGYFGSGATTLAMPDLTGVAGYNAAWFPVGVSSPFPWTLSGYSVINQATACVDGGSLRTSGVSGMQ